MARGLREAGIYVHFPYCLRKCPYCDFASVAAERDASGQREYVEAVLREARMRAAQGCEPMAITSIYVGGGTPSLLEPRNMEALLKGIAEAFNVDLAHAEVTAECNPSSLDEADAAALVGAGMNRLSVGLQSTFDDHLAFLGRLHDAERGLRAVRGALSSGAARVSADVIIGLPGEGPQRAVEDACAAAALGVGHLSVYLLTIEGGTPFGREEREGKLTLDEGLAAESYLAVSDALSAKGYEHYEVSNYARGGERSRHNSAVWRGGSYVGLGAGAVGTVREAGVWARYRNEPDPRRYMRGVGGADALAWGEAGGCVESVEVFGAETRMRERIMLGLRTAEGVDLSEAGDELGVEGWTDERRRAAARLQARGRIELQGSRAIIPREQWIWESDTIARLL